MNIPTLTTSRLSLRPWRLEDAQQLLSILQEPDILQYFPPTTPATLDKMERYIHHHHQHWTEYGYGHWAVTRSTDDIILGWTGLEFLPETRESEVAYLFTHAVWGQGLATEAAQAAVDFGLNHVGLKSIIGLVHPENIASRRVLEKIGLTYTCRAPYFGMLLDRFLIEKITP